MRNRIILLLILLLAFILRFWQLGGNPISLDWDEASLGYNAYSILKTARDEYGSFLPLSFRSFGDYKPPLYEYLTVIPVAIFGLTEFSTRFISALAGTGAVITSYFLIKELYPGKKNRLYQIFTFFIAVSPWHIQFSRVAFEANTALFFFITAVWLYIKGLRKGFFFLPSFLSFALSAYAYHSPRLVIPALLLGLTLIYRKELKQKAGWYISGIAVCVILVLPILRELSTATGARLGSVTIMNAQERLGESLGAIEKDKKEGNFLGLLTHNRRIVFARDILSGYLDHFNFDFLFITGDSPGRHHAYGMGMLYIWELPFIISGIYYLLQNRNKSAYVIFWWFLISPVASSITKGTPHAVRSLLYLPTYQIFSAFGLVTIVYYLNKNYKKRTAGIFKVIVGGLFILNFYYYLNMYWIHSPVIYADWWQYGYKQAFSEVNKLEGKYNRIIFTYQYDQPYIYYLFYNKVDPSWYQKNWGGKEVLRDIRAFGKYEFRKINWNTDSNLSNVLFIGTPKEIPDEISGKISDIVFPDGSVAFRIVGR